MVLPIGRKNVNTQSGYTVAKQRSNKDEGYSILGMATKALLKRIAEGKRAGWDQER